MDLMAGSGGGWMEQEEEEDVGGYRRRRFITNIYMLEKWVNTFRELPLRERTQYTSDRNSIVMIYCSPFLIQSDVLLIFFAI